MSHCSFLSVLIPACMLTSCPTTCTPRAVGCKVSQAARQHSARTQSVVGTWQRLINERLWTQYYPTVTDYRGHRRTLLPAWEINLKACTLSSTIEPAMQAQVTSLKPGFHYPNWWPELTAELTGDRFPLPVNMGSVDGCAVSTSRVDGPSTPLVETGL